MRRNFNLATTFFFLLMAGGYIMLIYQVFVQTGDVFSDYRPSSKGGVNLSKDELMKHKPVRVVCEADFYWQKLLTPDDFATSNPIRWLYSHSRHMERI